MACIAKIGPYSFGDNPSPCSGGITRLSKFWATSRDGDLDAYICDRHASEWLANYSRGFLYEKIMEAHYGTP